MSFQEALENPAIVGLCPAGAQQVIAGLNQLGYDTSLLINGHALMAGGLEKNGKGGSLLHDGKGIDHLSPQFFADVDPLIGEAFGLCPWAAGCRGLPGCGVAAPAGLAPPMG